jgi:MFS family permease
VFLLDGAAYFGILNILTLHLGTTVGLGDAWSGQLVSYMTGMLTLFMAFFGSAVDRLGVRRSMTITIVASPSSAGSCWSQPSARRLAGRGVRRAHRSWPSARGCCRPPSTRP